MLESVSNKVTDLKTFNYIKRDPEQVLPCEFYEIFKKIFFYRAPLVVACEQLAFESSLKEFKVDDLQSSQ